MQAALAVAGVWIWEQWSWKLGLCCGCPVWGGGLDFVELLRVAWKAAPLEHLRGNWSKTSVCPILQEFWLES